MIVIPICCTPYGMWNAYPDRHTPAQAAAMTRAAISRGYTITQAAAAILAADGATMYRCIDDTYDPHGMIYDSPAEFLAMCRECFGDAPELRETDAGWTDTAGRLVLQIVNV